MLLDLIDCFNCFFCWAVGVVYCFIEYVCFILNCVLLFWLCLVLVRFCLLWWFIAYFWFYLWCIVFWRWFTCVVVYCFGLVWCVAFDDWTCCGSDWWFAEEWQHVLLLKLVDLDLMFTFCWFGCYFRLLLFGLGMMVCCLLIRLWLNLLVYFNSNYAFLLFFVLYY